MISKLIMTAAVVGILSSTALAQVNDKYKDASRQLVGEATVALRAEKPEEAQVLYERALVANPANLHALVGLGKTHEAQGRIGRGLKYYRQALAVDPNAMVALEAQAVAFLKRDMVGRAEANRSKLASLCETGCQSLDMVKTAIEAYRAEKAEADSAAKVAENVS
ncbi:tetratricopeptide repeat protein [Kordiimonas aquimaris]|uniref:tetratricopeptide repeat protein n=1 Tax=Kordiimonas aquimaris TaxID=707591 RepID=UPI0021D0A2DE|nr:tetratricopeptide repeat protein [Kordiimonas aquimaris]